MKLRSTPLLLSAICLLLGILMVSQFRAHPVDRDVTAQSPDDQATIISRLYRSNQEQRAALDELNAEIADYKKKGTEGSNFLSLIDDLRQLRVFNGGVDIAGPGVQVRISGGSGLVQVLQDLTNELRTSGAEALAINDVRLISRSVITEDENHNIIVDKQPISPPYLLEAIGDASTLYNALERKGGLIEVLQHDQGDSLSIKVISRGDEADPIRLRKTAIDTRWHYAKPIEN
jgi:uncharacterized protein YlxW (UPF0749 family)